MNAARFVATVGGTGHLPRAPGTWGSLIALPLANLLHWIGSFPLLAIATIAVTILGYWSVSVASRGTTDPDASEYVIDEVAGQWIALWPLSGGLWYAGSALDVFPWPGVVGAFVFFRLFDILKPPPVGWADRMKTPLGVMLDDIFAGFMAAIVVAITAAVAHIWLIP